MNNRRKGNLKVRVQSFQLPMPGPGPGMETVEVERGTKKRAVLEPVTRWLVKSQRNRGVRTTPQFQH